MLRVPSTQTTSQPTDRPISSSRQPTGQFQKPIDQPTNQVSPSPQIQRNTLCVGVQQQRERKNTKRRLNNTKNKPESRYRSAPLPLIQPPSHRRQHSHPWPTSKLEALAAVFFLLHAEHAHVGHNSIILSAGTQEEAPTTGSERGSVRCFCEGGVLLRHIAAASSAIALYSRAV